MENTARKVLTDEILPEHTTKLDEMFENKLAAVESRVESRFNDQLQVSFWNISIYKLQSSRTPVRLDNSVDLQIDEKR